MLELSVEIALEWKNVLMRTARAALFDRIVSFARNHLVNGQFARYIEQ